MDGRQRLAVHADGEHRVAAVESRPPSACRWSCRRPSVDTIWSAPAWTPASLEQVGQRDADPAGVADVLAADLVGDAGQGDVALDRRVARAGPRRSARPRDRPCRGCAVATRRASIDGDLERRVDAVEVGVRGDERGDVRRCPRSAPAGDGAQRVRAARGWPGRRRRRPPPTDERRARRRDRRETTMRTPVAAPAARGSRARERRPSGARRGWRVVGCTEQRALEDDAGRAIADRRADERRDGADDGAARAGRARRSPRRARSAPIATTASSRVAERRRARSPIATTATVAEMPPSRATLSFAPERPDGEALQPLGRQVDERAADREQRRGRRPDHARDEVADGERRAGREESTEPGSQ